MKDGKFVVGEIVLVKFKVENATQTGVFIYPANGDESAGQWYYKKELEKSIVEVKNA